MTIGIIQQAMNGIIAIMVAKLALNDVPHYLFSETTHRSIRIVPPFKPHKHPAEPVARVVIVPGGSRWRCVKCGVMLEAGEEAVRVGGKVYCVECARSGNPNLTTKLYHVTHKDNLPGIMAEGLKRQNQWIFFFATFEAAKESGLSDMAILEVTLTNEDVDKCEIGEVFPELFEEKFGGEPPGDVSLKDYLANPRQYGVAEVCCTVDRIPPERIKYIETIKRIEYS